MATPVFKFQHPDLPGEDLYFIQNTFFELPQTVPMDLASFIWYHKEINRTLEGFIWCWKNLCEFQTTLNGFDFKSLDYTVDRYIIDSVTGSINDKYLVFRNDRITV